MATKPTMTVPELVDEKAEKSGRTGRSCLPGRVALAKVDQLVSRFEEHLRADNEQLTQIRDDIGDIRSEDVSGLRGEIRRIDDRVSDLRVDMAKALSGLNSIRTALDGQEAIKHVTMVAQVETGTARTLAAISDESDKKKSRRQVSTTAFKVVIGLLGGALGMIIEHYR